jgi:hypothetical protein
MAALGYEAVGPIVGIYAFPELGIRMNEGFVPSIGDGDAIKGVLIQVEETDPDFIGN